MENNNKVLIIGSNGQLGHDLVETAPENLQLISLTHKDIEICDYDDTEGIIKKNKPRYVIDLAAFHQTDVCEDDIETSFAVNCYAKKNIARVCNEIGAAVVYLSTDYVFDGQEDTPRTEQDPTNPINIYGISKLAGEFIVKSYANEYFIFRVSGLYGIAGSSGKGGNFIETMLRLANEKRSIKVVNDQVLTPTNTNELSNKIWEVLLTGKFGLYHCTNQGECSWYEFAKEIFLQMDLNVKLSSQSTSESGAQALRPRYSVLENQGLKDIGISDMKHWKVALNDYLVKKHSAKNIH
jgi:dTDP-4-dehydrorhamnose reductase